MELFFGLKLQMTGNTRACVCTPAPLLSPVDLDDIINQCIAIIGWQATPFSKRPPCTGWDPRSGDINT